MLLCQLAKYLNVCLPLRTWLILTDFYALTHLKAFCIGIDLKMYLSTLTKPYMSLNELLLEWIREVRNEKVFIRPLIQPISWRGLHTCCHSSDVFFQSAFRGLKGGLILEDHSAV